MNHITSIEARVAEHYSALSGQLRRAADYVVSNPVDVATRSLRSISATSEISPATYSRLSRALGFDSYEEMRERSRLRIGKKEPSFSDKAERLRAESNPQSSILQRQGHACIDNISALVSGMDNAKLEAAADRLRDARRVVLFGALGSTGIVEYMAYLARYFAPNWSLAGRMGASLGSSMAGLKADDVVLVVTKTPYVRRAVIAAELARDAGADVILLTDMHRCPAIPHATHAFIVPSESPQFFSSYVATLTLIETMIAMIVASSTEDATASIRAVEEKNQKLGEYWAE